MLTQIQNALDFRTTDSGKMLRFTSPSKPPPQVDKNRCHLTTLEDDSMAQTSSEQA